MRVISHKATLGSTPLGEHVGAANGADHVVLAGEPCELRKGVLAAAIGPDMLLPVVFGDEEDCHFLK